MRYTMRSVWLFAVAVGLAMSVAVGQSITTAQQVAVGAGWTVTFSDGTVVTVPNDPNNRHYVLLQQWIASGNTPASAPTPDPTQTKRDTVEKIAHLQALRLGLVEERTYWEGQGATARVNRINTFIGQVEAKIDDLRPQT